MIYWNIPRLGGIMKIKEIIDKVDEMKPNSILEKKKVDWISELDGKAYEEIFSRAADYTEGFTPYQYGSHEEVSVLIPFPYTDIYEYYLSAMIDKINEEIQSYNNNTAMFNESYEKFAAYYRRNHIPKSFR
jgi:hypothetical protein